MRRVQPGFIHPEQLQTLTLSIPEGQVKDPEQVMRMEDAIRQKIAGVPGVESVALGSTVPMSGMNSFNPVIVENQAQPEGKLVPLVELVGVVVDRKADRKTLEHRTLWIETQRNPTTADGSIHERASLVTYRIRHALAPALNPTKCCMKPG